MNNYMKNTISNQEYIDCSMNDQLNHKQQEQEKLNHKSEHQRFRQTSDDLQNQFYEHDEDFQSENSPMIEQKYDHQPRQNYHHDQVNRQLNFESVDQRGGNVCNREDSLLRRIGNFVYDSISCKKPRAWCKKVTTRKPATQQEADRSYLGKRKSIMRDDYYEPSYQNNHDISSEQIDTREQYVQPRSSKRMKATMHEEIQSSNQSMNSSFRQQSPPRMTDQSSSRIVQTDQNNGQLASKKAVIQGGGTGLFSGFAKAHSTGEQQIRPSNEGSEVSAQQSEVDRLNKLIDDKNSMIDQLISQRKLTIQKNDSMNNQDLSAQQQRGNTGQMRQSTQNLRNPHVSSLGISEQSSQQNRLEDAQAQMSSQRGRRSSFQEEQQSNTANMPKNKAANSNQIPQRNQHHLNTCNLSNQHLNRSQEQINTGANFMIPSTLRRVTNTNSGRADQTIDETNSTKHPPKTNFNDWMQQTNTGISQAPKPQQSQKQLQIVPTTGELNKFKLPVYPIDQTTVNKEESLEKVGTQLNFFNKYIELLSSNQSAYCLVDTETLNQCSSQSQSEYLTYFMDRLRSLKQNYYICAIFAQYSQSEDNSCYRVYVLRKTSIMSYIVYNNDHKPFMLNKIEKCLQIHRTLWPRDSNSISPRRTEAKINTAQGAIQEMVLLLYLRQKTLCVEQQGDKYDWQGFKNLILQKNLDSFWRCFVQFEVDQKTIQ